MNDVNAALAAADLSLAILSAFESIGYSVGAKITNSLLPFINQPNPGTAGITLKANLYQSSASTSLTTDSGTYSMRPRLRNASVP